MQISQPPTHAMQFSNELTSHIRRKRSCQTSNPLPVLRANPPLPPGVVYESIPVPNGPIIPQARDVRLVHSEFKPTGVFCPVQLWMAVLSAAAHFKGGDAIKKMIAPGPNNTHIVNFKSGSFLIDEQLPFYDETNARNYYKYSLIGTSWAARLHKAIVMTHYKGGYEGTCDSKAIINDFPGISGFDESNARKLDNLNPIGELNGQRPLILTDKKGNYSAVTGVVTDPSNPYRVLSVQYWDPSGWNMVPQEMTSEQYANQALANPLYLIAGDIQSS